MKSSGGSSVGEVMVDAVIPPNPTTDEIELELEELATASLLR